ncbi:hypothetical protein HMPREF1407_00132, partial [Helicobacter pylori GAM244Ai]
QDRIKTLESNENTLKSDLNAKESVIQEKDKTINELQERPTTEQYSQLEQANSEQTQTIQEKDKEIATLNTLNAKLEKTNQALQRPNMWDTVKESITTITDKVTGNTKREIEELERKVANKEYSLDFYRNELRKEQQKRYALEKEIATALDTANEYFQSKEENLQEAVERNKIITEQYFLLDSFYNDPNSTNEYVNKLVEKHKHRAVFTKLLNAIKELFSLRKLVANIKKILFGDEKTEKDHQDILNAISELQERPTKQQLEAKEKEINTLQQDKTTLTNKLQEQNKTINELNKFKNSSNLALDLEKAQDRIKTL